MKQSFLSFVKYYLFWIVYFFFFKIFFLLFNFSATKDLGAVDIFGIFLHGIVMDFSSAGYFSFLPGLLFALLAFVNAGIISKILKGFTLLLLVSVTFLGLMDAALYGPWGTRLNGQIIPYFSNIGGMWASLSWWQWFLTLAVEASIVALFYYLYKRFFALSLKKTVSYRWFVIPVMLFCTAALIIPVRGGFDRAPLNHSSVYFSQKLYANHAAYNYFWTFMYAATHRDENKNPVNYMTEADCAKQMDGLDQLNQGKFPVYVHAKNGKPVNVVYVILESFSNKVIEPLGGMPSLCPNLNAFCNEGIVFKNLIATGSRSDRGISAIMCAYPGLIKASAVLNFPEKLKSMDFFPQYFKTHGYDLSFYYGGDVNFYNTRMLLMLSGMNRIVSKEDYPIAQHEQKWGVPDEVLYNRMYEDLMKNQQPFLSMVYNISSHEPYDVPARYNRIKGLSSTDKYCNSVAYADSCLGDFINKLKKTDFWANTLVVITPDHASLEPGPTTLQDLATFKVPLILIGGAVDTVMLVDKYAQQTDIASTIIQQLGWTPKPSYFSRNLFGNENYAFFNNIDGWGYASPEFGFYMDVESKKQTYYYGEDYAKKDSVEHFAEAYTQFLHNDFMKR